MGLTLLVIFAIGTVVEALREYLGNTYHHKSRLVEFFRCLAVGMLWPLVLLYWICCKLGFMR